MFVKGSERRHGDLSPGRRLCDIDPPRLIDGETRLSPAEVGQLTMRLTGGLQARGIRRGDRVAFQLPNWWETVVLYRACWALGAVACPIHPREGERGRDGLLARLRPRLAIIGAGLPPDPGSISVRGLNDGFRLLLGSSPAGIDPDVSPSDLALLIPTAGSTGVPKLVRHPHSTLAYKAPRLAAAHGLTSGDVILVPMPLGHISGLMMGVLVAGSAQMTTVLMDRWKGATGLELLQRWGVTFMVGPPTFVTDIFSEPGFDPEAARALRLISCGGSGVTPGFLELARQLPSARVKRSYGSTEAPSVTTTHEGDPWEMATTTDGRASGETELHVVNPTSRELLPAGEVGELEVRGPEVCDGYEDSEQTALAFTREGFFRTGDLATLDAQGWLTIVGRLQELIIRGGENVSPAAVEGACAKLPGLRRAVAVGIPDPRLGERVGLVYEGDTELRLSQVQGVCEIHGLPRFAWPEKLLRVESIPVSDTGKLDRRATADRIGKTGFV